MISRIILQILFRFELGRRTFTISIAIRIERETTLVNISSSFFFSPLLFAPLISIGNQVVDFISNERGKKREIGNDREGNRDRSNVSLELLG